MSEDIPAGKKTDTATFGTGCFWCTEAVFQELKGVLKTVSGYSGGTVAHPSYQDVCTSTDTAEITRSLHDTTPLKNQAVIIQKDIPLFNGNYKTAIGILKFEEKP